MLHIKPSTKALVFIGTGGVGKTTLSASIALALAEQGKKVHIMTIDPSLRLAQALGFSPDGHDHEVQHERIRGSGGQLVASVLNHERVFEEFLINSLKNSRSEASTASLEADVNSIRANKLFKQLSTKLSGSQDFTAIYKLNELVKSKKYDLVILDTPPAQHTWQFLRAPEKIAQLFNEGVAQWFRQSGEEVGLVRRFLNVGTAQVLRALELLTGSEFIHELSLFFKAIQKWQLPLEKEVMDCHSRLTSQQTEFILVTGLGPTQVLEANKISSAVIKEGFGLSAVVINRYPDWLLQAQLKPEVTASAEGVKFGALKTFYQSLSANLVQSQKDFDKRLVLYKSSEIRQREVSIDGLLQTGRNVQSLS